ncbi:MAG: hypothetical protein SPL78_06505 [Bacteroidales bacterium]|nr:hypothetical protein [Bacteroidales bacterium]
MNKLLTAILCTLAVTTAWAADEVYKTLTFSSSTNSKAVSSYTDTWSATINGFSWTIENFNNNNNAWNFIRAGRKDYTSVANISTNAAIDKAITKVVVTVDAYTTDKINSTKLYVASNASFTQNLQTIALGASVGEMVYTINNPSENMYYKLEYDCAQGSSNGLIQISKVQYYYSTAPSIPTVTGIAAFKRVTAGTTVQLYLPDDYNARVTHVEAGNGGTVDAYVRDDTGAMRMTGISPNRAMTYDQHLAGWITGKYTIGADGIPQFEPADGLTNTDQLVIADRVTEEITQPKVIDAGAMGNNLANWVTISDLEVTGNNVDASKFNLAYQDQAYAGAIVDITGIAASGKLYPVDDLNKAPITFVVDAEKSFTSPSASIENANVRLKRTLSSSQWNLLTVPFDIDINDFDGEVMQYTGVELGKVGSYVYNGNTYDIQGGVMRFGYLNTGSVMQAGVPYLVKPGSSMRNSQTFNAVTLSNAPAGTITKTLPATAQASMGNGLMAQSSPVWAGDYSLVGSYSPVTLDKNEGTVVFTGNNEISWTSLINDVTAVEVGGTQGYITIPSGAGVALGLEDNSEPVITAITTVAMRHGMPAETVIYNLMGQRLTRPLGELPPGIYIVNGKKIVKR